MKNKFIIFLIVAFIIFGILLLGDDEEQEVIVNQGQDTYTLMVYMCASDLETEDGSATDDIKEMLQASIDSKVNVVMETGGTTMWRDLNIASNTNQRYKIESGEFKLLENNLGIREMVKPETLSDFIIYCKDKYPADHYGLIMWDHGGGSVSGFGYDEHSQNEDDTLTLDELKYALQTSGVHFDFIGFDACLMATAETAYSLKDHSNYLVASEETEPGTGWEYTSLLNTISKNTSQNTLDILKVVVDKYIETNNGWLDFYDATLSVIELNKVDDLYKSLYDFMFLIEKEDLDNNRFSVISKAVDNTKSYAEGEYDTIDLYDFAEIINNGKTEELKKAIESAIPYYKNNDLIERTHGVSLYFPYNDLTYYEDMYNIYSNIGISQDYINVLTKFVNIMAGGKNKSYSINSHEYSVDEEYNNYNWYNQDIINDNYQTYSEYESPTLEITQVGDDYILELTDEDWKIITNITCEVLYDDGEGYIDLGSDDYYELDSQNNLKIDYDGLWVAIEGQTVPFYTYESNDKVSKGEVNAYVNDKESKIIVMWDEKNPDGKVLGYEPVSYGNTTLSSKGLTQFKNGDKIEFVFDYYTYDGEYDDQYIIGDELIVKDNNLRVSYEEVGSGEFYVYYKITDIYNNEYYTEALIFE